MIANTLRQRLYMIATCILVAGGWEVAGRMPVHGTRVFPSLTDIVKDYAAESELYLHHTAATLFTAAAGLGIGVLAAAGAALLFVMLPVTERLLSGVNITIFSIPMIALGPLLVLMLSGSWPQIVLAAVMVYFPTMTALVTGLRDIDPRHEDLVRVYSGKGGAVLWHVRLRNAVPAGLSGLKVASSVAVLGAILGEFGSGERWGLGSFLLASLAEANAARLWGISIASAAIALAGYAICSLVAKRYVTTTAQVTVAANRPKSNRPASPQERARARIVAFASCVLPFLIWWLGLKAIGMSPIVAPGPTDLIAYLLYQPGAADAREALFNSLCSTVPMALAGMLAGLAVAFFLAAMSVVTPRILKVILPIAMVLQNTPLVALTPIVLLLLGRSITASLAMAVLVVFFPAFVILVQGFQLVPRAARETVQVYGGSTLRQLHFISIPYSIEYLFLAAKLVAPRALLGVMVAEWLLTGTGLGNLLDVSRSSLDYGMVWSGAIISIVLSLIAFSAVTLAERACARR